MQYDPLKPPDLQAWQALDEGEQIELVRAYHRRNHMRPPNPRLHAAIHTMVENQSALGDVIPVRRTLERLQQEGLDRHEAVHAVGIILVAHLNDLVGSPRSVADPNAAYYEQLSGLTATGWRRQLADDS
jgi:hypothetical protein